MSKLVIIFGPPAVGKMTIGKALAEKCDLKFMMNHDTIELLLPHFEWGSPSFKKLNDLFRFEILKEHAQGSSNGLVFTFLWDLNSPTDKNVIDQYKSLFESSDGETFFVELSATLDTRLKRNKHPERIEAKPSKRDIKKSEQRLLETESYKVNSNGDFYYKDKNYIRVDNTNMEADSVVGHICKEFEW